ncbi:MAG TPA: hypothetical protein VGA85_00890 [Dehalococcoidales bacterium]
MGSASAGLGMTTGIFVYGNQKTYNIIDPTSFQNFSVFAGALTGLTICILTVVLYLLVRKLLHHVGFHYRFFLIFSGVAGIAIGLATYAVINLSATSYGVVGSVTGFTAVIEAISFAILGGLAGVLTGVILNLIRGYNY